MVQSAAETLGELEPGRLLLVGTALSAGWVKVTESALISLRMSRSEIGWSHSPM